MSNVGTTEDVGRRLLSTFAETRAQAVARNDALTIAGLWDLFMAKRDRQKLRNDIYAANWTALSKFFAHRQPDSITEDDCMLYSEQRFALGRAPSTVYTELVRLRECFEWAQRNRKILHVPPMFIPSRGPGRSRVLTYDEARSLLFTAKVQSDPHIYLFIVLLMTTGARHKAILDLTWDRVNFIRGFIEYDEPEPFDPMSKSWRKGRATVPMGSVAREALEPAFLGRQTNHVIEHGGRRLKSCRDGFASAVERAGLDPEITPHTIRHSVVTWARTKGADFHNIAQLVGHSDSKTTELIYTHIEDTVQYLKPTIDIIDAEFKQVPGPVPKKKVSPKPKKKNDGSEPSAT